MKKTFFILCTLIITLNCFAQTDSVRVKKHNPKIATSLSIIPGAGQIYNKKYWKLPIIYGGLGTTGGLIFYYQSETAKYKKEYVARVNEDTLKFNSKLANVPTENVKELRDYYRKNMEICIAACVLIYTLNILDACVDAHLFYYDISDNLALQIAPTINYHPMRRTPTPCLALFINF
jgi:TM2 domain-containing membrane protein YozV